MVDTKDLAYAKKEFKRGLAFVVVKNEEILAESTEKGVAPFFYAVNGLDVKGASLADKIVGKAVALLSVYAGIASVYTPVVSDAAVEVLHEYSIYLEADEEVTMILNSTRDDQCPIEKMVSDCGGPEEAYKKLKRRFEG